MNKIIVLPLEVIQDRRLTLIQLRVLCALYSFRDRDTNVAWPSRQTLAIRAGGYSTTVISRTTTQLVELGWLEKSGNGGNGRSCDYRVRVPELLKEGDRSGQGEGDRISHPLRTDHGTNLSTDVERGKSTHSEKKNGKTVAIPYYDILDAWNRICSTKLKGRADKLMPERRVAIRKIWDEDEDMRDMKSWEGYFEHCASDPFMRGKKNGKNHEGWLANFNYVIRYKTFVEVIERLPQ